MPFMDRNFLLPNETARSLYFDHAETQPIIDYHNHLSAREIAERRVFKNLTELWLEGDHYKWRAMRACGVDERLITGNASAYDKFLAWAEVVPMLAGCPIYHWTHLELQRYFGIAEPLTPKTAADIWAKTETMLPAMDTVTLLTMRNVRVLCTTDDPADTLEWHEKIAKDATIPIRVLPSFRPDRFLSLEMPGCDTLESAKAFLRGSLDRFEASGCRGADHGFTRFTYERGTDRAELLKWLGGEYARRGMVMQLHLGPVRNQSPRLMSLVGRDAGGDSVGCSCDPAAIGAFLGDLEAEGLLPNTILYNSNPSDNTAFATMAGNFSPKVQYGAAWWFNDTIRGMSRQLEELMENGMLARSVGMLTDSRSFSAFPRHEYYRRILCAKLGCLIEEGLYPNDPDTLGKMVEDICWKNAKDFFGMEDI